MQRFLSRLLGADAAESAGVRGLVFASLSRDERMAGAAPGEVVRNETSGPPWIVVSHDVDGVLGVGWPGRLWEVEVLEAASDQPLPYAGYTRAVAVKVLAELPVAILFGEHGADVVRVIEKARTIGVDEARELAARASDRAGEAYSRAWDAWLALVEPGSAHRGADHSDTLAVFVDRRRSPIGGGFTILSDVLGKRAREVAGDAAFTVDEEEEEIYLSAPWSGASAALLHAAMGLGAPELIPDEDRRALLEAWEHCFGR